MIRFFALFLFCASTAFAQYPPPILRNVSTTNASPHNANQFSASGTAITIKDGATLTNITNYASSAANTPLSIIGPANHTTNLFEVMTNGGTRYFAVKSNGVVCVVDGTQGSPSIVWMSDDDGTGLGFYRSAANDLGLAINGVGRFRWNSSYFRIVSDTIGLLFGASGDIGLYRETATGLSVKNAAGTSYGNLTASNVMASVSLISSNGIYNLGNTVDTSAGTATTQNRTAGKVRLSVGSAIYYVTNSIVSGTNALAIACFNTDQNLSWTSGLASGITCVPTNGLLRIILDAAPDNAPVDITWMLIQP